MAAVPSLKLIEGSPPNLAGKGTPGKPSCWRDIDVVVQIVAVRIEVIEAEAKFINQIVTESMNLAGGEPSATLSL